MKSVLRHIYNVIPFKRQLFTLLRPLGLGDNITRHLVFFGVIKIKINDVTSFKMLNKGYELEQKLFWKGLNAWESYSNKIWMELSKNANTIFDIGANSGIFTMLAKSVNNQSKVFAVEPIKRIYDLLNTNVAINHFNDVITINKAVSNENGSAEIQDVADGVLYEASLEKGFTDTREHLKRNNTQIIIHQVEVITLNNIIAQYNINSIDLMKIDVETHEPAVIEGMGVYLDKFRPVLIVEILNDSVAHKLSGYFNTGNYVFFNINEDTGYEKVSTLTPSSHYNFIICPCEKESMLQNAINSCMKSS